MGYYVTLIESDWHVPETPEVLDALRRIDTEWHELKRGGRWSAGEAAESWFSWMNGDWTDADKVQDIFHMLGFETHAIGDGTVNVFGYDNKAGQEELFLAAVAPYMKPGSYMEWRGEDGAAWKYVVADGRLMYQESRKMWSDPAPFIYTHFDSQYDDDGKYAGTFSVAVDVYSDTPVGLQVKAGRVRAKKGAL